ncbi:hypothetical protein TTHERM_01084310 (macronuclear) [Tetrahymena thermophila SB210]|uniref:Uncharacterized protein n=1 Tax=Tetrahymena thermophila (strain SB210) TaxID=312017 RepID=Q22BT6_TETTS|nr:hypothetical protein TTHERM_01084310 [Tetrahymena thermophila SB210]EAR82764.1 hypothetical protein TTHERM_01084310 [Tetrahymena thermophila SB210]|eukprot:XP_001030427.1 hypothetical protein TTHERM_01084310 [Tetrahymena thermophila SB210]
MSNIFKYKQQLNFNNNTQNSLSSLDDNTPKTIGSLNTASQLSFGELTNSPIIEDKSSMYYQNSIGHKNRSVNENNNLKRIQRHRQLVQNNIKELAKVINHNYENKSNNLSKQNQQNINNSPYFNKLKINIVSKDLKSLTNITKDQQKILGKRKVNKRYSALQSETKNSALDQSEYFSTRSSKPKLSFQGQFESSQSSFQQLQLPSLTFKDNQTSTLKYQSLVNIKLKESQQSEEKLIKIEDYSNDKEINKGNLNNQQITKQSETINSINIDKSNFYEKFQIFLQNFPSQFRKLINKNENLCNALDFFRIESIKSQSAQLDLLIKFLINCLKMFFKEIKQIEESLDSQFFMNDVQNINQPMKQPKNKIIINCATAQLKLSKNLFNDICETVFQILQKFEIPNIHFKDIKKLIAQQWDSQLSCVTFADKIGGYRNLLPIIDNLSNQIIDTFQLSKQEQEYLELQNYSKLLEIMKEIIKKYSQEVEEINKVQAKASNQKSMLEDYIAKIKAVFQSKSCFGAFSKNTPFFLVKYILWNALFNSAQGNLFPNEIKLFIMSIFEKLRNECFSTAYWKQDMISQQRMNILYNTISSKQQLLKYLGPYFVSQEKIFCKALLQFIIGQNTTSEFLNNIKEQIDLSSNYQYFMNQINIAMQEALMTNSMIALSNIRILLQNKFFLINQNLNQKIFLKESFLQEHSIQIKSSDSTSIEQTMQIILSLLLSQFNRKQENQDNLSNYFISQQKLSYNEKIQIVTKYLLTIILDTKSYSVFDIQEILDIHQLEKNIQLKQNILNESKKILYSIKLSIQQVNIIQQLLECSIFPANS